MICFETKCFVTYLFLASVIAFSDFMEHSINFFAIPLPNLTLIMSDQWEEDIYMVVSAVGKLIQSEWVPINAVYGFV